MFGLTKEELHSYLNGRAAGMEIALQYLLANNFHDAADSLANSLTYRVARMAPRMSLDKLEASVHARS